MTDVEKILKEIKFIQYELKYNRKLTKEDRLMYRDDLEFLKNQLPKD